MAKRSGVEVDELPDDGTDNDKSNFFGLYGSRTLSMLAGTDALAETMEGYRNIYDTYRYSQSGDD